MRWECTSATAADERSAYIAGWVKHCIMSCSEYKVALCSDEQPRKRRRKQSSSEQISRVRLRTLSSTAALAAPNVAAVLCAFNNDETSLAHTTRCFAQVICVTRMSCIVLARYRYSSSRMCRVNSCRSPLTARHGQPRQPSPNSPEHPRQQRSPLPRSKSVLSYD